jgi:peptide/nickel transport system permease protein
MITSTTIGILSAYIGGKFDLIVQRVVDAWMCLPGLIVLMVIMNIMGRGMLPLIIAMGFFGAIGGSRVKRSAVIAIRENVYVQAAVAVGCSHTRILIRHILPNIMGVIIIGFTMGVPGFIMQEASLSFLGFGIPPPSASWGGMIVLAKSFMFEFPWLIIWPGLALALVVYGINMFGDAMRDILDPRLRGGVGRYGVRVKKEAIVKSEPGVSPRY